MGFIDKLTYLDQTKYPKCPDCNARCTGCEECGYIFNCPCTPHDKHEGPID